MSQYAYNATLKGFDAEGTHIMTGACRAEMVNGRVQMFRSCGHQTYRYEDKVFARDDAELGVKKGDAVYDYYYRATSVGDDHLIARIEIDLDDCRGYHEKVNGLMVPPTYKFTTE